MTYAQPFIAPDIPDATDDELRERRRDMLHSLTIEQIIDMVCDDPMLGHVLKAGIVVPYANGDQDPADAKYLYGRMRDILEPKLEQYLDANE